MAQEAKCLRTLRGDSKGCACKRSRGRARVTESSPGHQDSKGQRKLAFFIYGPGSKVPAHFAWGLEGLRLQAQPGSRSCDRVLSWAPRFKRSAQAGLFHLWPRKQSACALCVGTRRAALASAAGVALV